jgi:ATP phosphoribosyltransferase regulatory subunit
VLHTRPDKPHATREPLQLGAEIYGHAGLEADLEAQQLALDCLAQAGVSGITLDMADVRLVKAIFAQTDASDTQLQAVQSALGTKDRSLLQDLTASWPAPAREQLLALLDLYGDDSVLEKAKFALAQLAGAVGMIEQMQWLANHIRAHAPQVRVSFDLADVRAYAYYTGVRFAIYAQGMADALVRGGRYDEIGAVFGRNRPAVGFSLDLKELVRVAASRPLKAAVRAPWGDAVALRAAIARLRAQGETVLCVMPGHENDIQEFQCDRDLIEVSGQWVIQAVQ